MAKKWQIKSNGCIKKNDDIIPTILRCRDYSESEKKIFLSSDYDLISDPMLMPGIKQAIARIYKAIKNQELIRIYGDYDIDGISATALMVDSLAKMGACVEPYIPDRFIEGYGLNTEAIDELGKAGTELIITVDCGVNSNAEVQHAKKLNIDVIVTDHHTISDQPPQSAVAVLNPKLKNSKYPAKDISGVGVAFCLIRGIQKKYPQLLATGQEKWLLDLVALGTICDVVPLRGENWLLAKYGLTVLRKTRRIGLIELAKISGIDVNKINEADVGFRIGPRLNAAGRVEHANMALDILLCKNIADAKELAQKLNQLNQLRQSQTKDIYDEARALAKEQNQPTIVLASPNWSHGVVGIVASKIAEEFNKPTILMQINDSLAKGSGRSIEGFDLISAISAAESVLIKYGGHKYAAGVTLKKSDIAKFHEILNSSLHKSKPATAKMPVDSELDIEAVDLETVNKCEELSPYGNTHEKFIFTAEYELIGFNFVGADKNHAKLILKTNHGAQISAIGFNQADKCEKLKKGDLIKIVFNIEGNIWNNSTNPQLVIIDIKNENAEV